MRMRDKIILRVVGKAVVPFFFLFALYVQFHGDFGPGGGFQAGVIFAAGIILYALIFGLDAAKRVVPPRALEAGVALGVLLWAGTAVATLMAGGNFLDYGALLSSNDPAHFEEARVHGQHLGIMIVEAGVLFTVTSGMSLIFYLFAGRAYR